MSDLDALSLLFGSELGPRFLSENWPLEPCWYHGPASRLAEIIEQPCFQSPAELLKLPVERVIVQANVKNSEPLRSVNGRGGLSGAERTELMALYGAGFQLYFHELQGLPAPLEKLLERVAEALGLTRQMISVNAFACIAGSRHPPPLHWDPSESFLIQCVGSKRWKLARNDFFPYPTFNHLFGASMPSEHVDELEAEYPTTPPDVREFVIRPGSTAFVPRGAWHCATSLDEASLHLDINLKVPSVSSELLHWVRRKLRRPSELRRPLTRHTPPEEVARTVELARQTLRELAEELSVADLVRLGMLAPGSWPYVYRRNGEVDVSLVGERTLKVRIEDDACEINLPARVRSAAQWIIECDEARPFGIGDLPPVESGQELLKLLDLLEDLGALAREEPVEASR